MKEQEYGQKDMTTSYFDSIAGIFHEANYKQYQMKFPLQMLRRGFAHQLILNRLPENSLILDIGCGSGALLESLAKDGFRICGIDISPAMINEAANRLSQFTNLGQESVISVGDVEALAFPDEHFDAVIALGVIEYLGSDEPALKEIYRVLKPRGIAIIEARNALFNLFSGNTYTLDACQSGQLQILVDEFASLVQQINDSSTQRESLSKSIADYVKYIRDNVEELVSSTDDTSIPGGTSAALPTRTMPRRQHTPATFQQTLSKAGLTPFLTRFMHLHPFPPTLEKVLPSAYVQLALAMETLGDSPIGAALGSVFIVCAMKDA